MAEQDEGKLEEFIKEGVEKISPTLPIVGPKGYSGSQFSEDVFSAVSAIAANEKDAQRLLEIISEYRHYKEEVSSDGYHCHSQCERIPVGVYLENAVNLIRNPKALFTRLCEAQGFPSPETQKKAIAYLRGLRGEGQSKEGKPSEGNFAGSGIASCARLHDKGGRNEDDPSSYHG